MRTINFLDWCFLNTWAYLAMKTYYSNKSFKIITNNAGLLGETEPPVEN